MRGTSEVLYDQVHSDVFSCSRTQVVIYIFSPQTNGPLPSERCISVFHGERLCHEAVICHLYFYLR